MATDDFLEEYEIDPITGKLRPKPNFPEPPTSQVRIISGPSTYSRAQIDAKLAGLGGSGGAPTGPAAGDLAGTYPNPTVLFSNDALHLLKALNLSDLANAGTARTNLVLGNVDNTSDVNKPVSTAQAVADSLRVLKAGDTMSGALVNTLASGNSLIYDTDTLIVDATNHRVGVGTTSPQSKLHLYSTGSANTISIDGNNFPAIVMRSSGTIMGYAPFLVTSNGGFFGDALVGDMGFRSQSNRVLFGSGAGNSTMAVSNTAVNISGQAQVTNIISATIASIIKGAASQSADLTQWQNSSGTVLSKIDSTGNLVLRGSYMRFQDSSGTNDVLVGQFITNELSFFNGTHALRISTLGGGIGIGASPNPSIGLTIQSTSNSQIGLRILTAGGGGQTARLLEVLDSGTPFNQAVTVEANLQTGFGMPNAVSVPSGGQVEIRNITTTDAVLRLRQVTSGTGDLLQAQNSSGTTLAKIDKAGHYYGGGTAPAIAAGTGAGTSPTLSLTGSDVAGQISITTGTLPTLSADVFTVTFNTGYATAPYVNFSPANAVTALLSGASMVYVTATTTTFKFTAGTTPLTAATTYLWNYSVIG